MPTERLAGDRGGDRGAGLARVGRRIGSGRSAAVARGRPAGRSRDRSRHARRGAGRSRRFGARAARRRAVAAISLRLAAGARLPADAVDPDGRRPVERGRHRGRLAARRPADRDPRPSTPRWACASPRRCRATRRSPRAIGWSVGGRLEALPADDGGYGTYLRRIGVAATLRARSLERLGDGRLRRRARSRASGGPRARP